MALQRITFGLALTLALGSASRIQAQSEILLGWQTAADAPDTRTLVWSETPILKAAAIEDLTEFRSAVAEVGQSQPAVMIAANGRTVAAAQPKKGADAAPATGVTIWPDWRIADSTLPIRRRA